MATVKIHTEFAVAEKDTTSCLTEECWTYDSSKKQCELADGCSTVTCTATSMIITLNKDVFGASASSSEISPTYVENDNGELVFTCELGKCGMNHYTEEDR